MCDAREECVNPCEFPKSPSGPGDKSVLTSSSTRRPPRRAKLIQGLDATLINSIRSGSQGIIKAKVTINIIFSQQRVIILISEETNLLWSWMPVVNATARVPLTKVWKMADNFKHITNMGRFVSKCTQGWNLILKCHVIKIIPRQWRRVFYDNRCFGQCIMSGQFD